MRQRIDNNYIDELRLHYADINYLIDGVDTVIVEDEETHYSLLRNFTINDSILKYYYHQTSKCLSDIEFEEMKKIGIVGDKEYLLSPYPLRIYGAYFHRVDLITKLSLLTFEKDDHVITLDGKKVEYFEDLYSYFDNYSEGFKDGFNNFENACIDRYLTKFADKKDYVNKVFEFLTKKIIFEHDWDNNHRGFSYKITGNNPKIMEISGGFENGKRQGRFYKAWSIVFSNNSIFEDLFTDYSSNFLKPLQQNVNFKPNDVYKTQNLFKVGLLFAEGEMNKYFTVNSKNATVMNSQYSAPQIANELGNESYNKYILASINNYTGKENGNKNIFNSLDMMTKIILHCETESIPVDAYFKSRLPIE